MLLIITSTCDKLFGFINIDDFEPPPQKKEFLVNFSYGGLKFKYSFKMH